MNKKRLIGYLFVTMSVGCIQAQEQKSSVPEYKLWYRLSRTGMDRSITPWEWPFGGHGIWNTRHRTNTTKRRKHLGGTSQ